MAKRGKLIVLEGIDGSGKATQSQLLAQRLKKEGHKVKEINFPQYEKWSSFLVKMYLRGRFGSPEGIGPRWPSLFYAIDRWSAKKTLRKWLEEGNLVICNRYATSNKGHQGSKIKNPADRKRFVRWLDRVEHKMLGIPRPDLVVLLEVPATVSIKLIADRNTRNKEKVKDIHENLKHLKNAEQTYKEMAREEGYKVIKCTETNQILPINIIHEKVWKVITENI